MRRVIDEATFGLASVFHALSPTTISPETNELGRLLTSCDPDVKSVLSADGINSWDGQLLVRMNQMLNGHHRVLDILRYGMNSCVYRCRTGDNGFSAVKVRKLGDSSESDFLLTFSESAKTDPRASPVGYATEIFAHEGHVCIAMPLLPHSVSESVATGQTVSARLARIRILARQLFESLAYIHSQGIIHCDVKPENVLYVDEAMTEIRLIDFGSAVEKGSRPRVKPMGGFVSPELILDLPINEMTDVWSVGCMCAEMFLDIPLFRMETECDMIHVISALLGDIDEAMITCAKSWYRFFDASIRGFEMKFDPGEILATRHPAMAVFEEHRDWTIVDLLASKKVGCSVDECAMIDLFTDFILRVLQVNPDRRLSAVQALTHPFIAGGELGSWEFVMDDRDILFGEVNEPVEEPPKAVPVQSQALDMNNSDFLSMF